MQKFNAQYAEMRLLAYHSVPLSVPCVLWKFEVRERFGLKLEVGELRSLAYSGTLTIEVAPFYGTHCIYLCVFSDC